MRTYPSFGLSFSSKYKAQGLYSCIIRSRPYNWQLSGLGLIFADMNLAASSMDYAVITGDIIQSSKLDAETRQWLMRSLKAALEQWDEDFEMESELIRGDSFQCLIPHPELALQIALLIRTYVRSLNPTSAYDIYHRENPAKGHSRLLTNWLFDVRIAIGVGEIDYEGDTLAESDGEAFQLSGRALDRLKDGRQNLAIVSNDKNKGELASMAPLLDAIMSGTTALQCEVINLKLLGHTEIDIAKILEINQSAVNQRSIAGNWGAIQSAVKRFGKIYGE
jgi:hypothetical protein